MASIVGLFRLRIRDERMVLEKVKGKPVYLGLAMDARKRVKMKPQNLLTNLPVIAPGLGGTQGTQSKSPRARARGLFVR